MESLLKYVQDNFIAKKDFPEFSAGDTITVYYEIYKEEVLELLKLLLFVKYLVM